MKQWLTENKVGPYTKTRLTEDGMPSPDMPVDDEGREMPTDESRDNLKLPDYKSKWNNMSSEERVESLRQNKFLGKQSDQRLQILAKLNFDQLFNATPEERMKLGIAPYASLLQGFAFPTTDDLGEAGYVMKTKDSEGNIM
tara:strand:+ start:768 stop:1190 length:423 start_codon:yes stop_codon:yes gene_type:complete